MRQRSTIVIKPRRGLLQFNLRETWAYRELLLFLTWREVAVRYKQSVIGVGWAIIQPVMSMIIFSLVIGEPADIPCA